MVSLRLVQDGVVVARTGGNVRENVERDMAHYAMMYGQDGDVEVYEGKKRRYDLEPGIVSAALDLFVTKLGWHVAEPSDG